jgi:hypothetical protein
LQSGNSNCQIASLTPILTLILVNYSLKNLFKNLSCAPSGTEMA